MSAVEFGELVQEKNTVMRERRLAGPRGRAAADESGSRDRVVGRAERPRPNQPVGVHSGDAVDPRHFDRLRVRHRRQDRRQPASEHRLARAGRPLEQQVVRARRRDLEREQRDLVTTDIRESGPCTRRSWLCGLRYGRQAPTGHGVDRSAEAGHAGDRQPVDECRLRARSRGTIRRGIPARVRLPRRRAPRRSHASRRRATARRTPRRRRAHRAALAARRQDRERHRGVEAGPGLAQERRGEVGGDPPLRELVARS